VINDLITKCLKGLSDFYEPFKGL